MRFNCDRKKILDSFNLVSSAITKSSINPIMQSVRVTTQGQSIILAATNQESTIETELAELDIERSGEACWPCSMLVSVLRESTSESVRFSQDGDILRVTTDTAEYVIPTHDPAGFPIISSNIEETPVVVGKSLLEQAIKRCEPAVSKVENKYAMTGMFFDLNKERLAVAATDGKRLAVCTLGATSDKPISAIIPMKSVRVAGSLMAASDDTSVTVCLNKRYASFQCGPSKITTLLIEGNFPPYNSILRKKHTSAVDFIANDWHHLVKQAVITSEGEYKRVDITLENDVVQMESQGAETGKSKIRGKAEYQLPKLEVSLCADYLLDLFRSLPGSEPVQACFGGKDAPVQFQLADGFIHLIVPLSRS